MTMRVPAMTAVLAGLISFVAPAGAQGPKNLVNLAPEGPGLRDQ